MLNSLAVFFSAIVFIVFGYLSLVRILYRQQFATGIGSLFFGLRDASNLKHIGSSAFFVSLPATSLLIFWGWGPALLWLVVFHLLADSLVNLQVTAVNHQVALSEYLVSSTSTLSSYLMRGIIQCYLVLLLAVVLTMLAQLIDKESGLLFALIGLIPVYRILRTDYNAIPALIKIVIALAVFGLAIVFANELGWAIYGDWAPFGEKLDWFRFNNTTILAAILLSGGFALANNTGFSNDVANMAGVIVIATIVILIVRLILLQPVLDAPMNSIQDSAEPLPFFVSFCVFLFAGLSTLFFRVFNSTAPSKAELAPAADFGRVQLESLLQLILAILLVLSLSSALGIGAWKTHYLDWSNQTNFISHLNLAITSLLKLIHSGATAGNLIHTAIMAGLCIAGLSFLRVCIKALSLAEDEDIQEDESKKSFGLALLKSKLLQGAAAFVASTYFIAHSISINVWLIIGMLSWVIVMQLIIAMTHAMREPSMARLVYGTQCLILLTLGAIQTTWTSINWALGQQFVFAGIGFGVLTLGMVLWWSPLYEIVTRFRQVENKRLFED